MIKGNGVMGTKGAVIIQKDGKVIPNPKMIRTEPTDDEKYSDIP